MLLLFIAINVTINIGYYSVFIIIIKKHVNESQTTVWIDWTFGIGYTLPFIFYIS